jgi:30S ribosomal protein S31
MNLNPAYPRGFLFLSSFIHSFKTYSMGRGDKKTAKGKRFKASFGKTRPAKATKIRKPVIKSQA